MAYSLDTNANSGASASVTLGTKTFGGKHTTGVPAWAVVVVVALVAVVLVKRKKGG